MRHLICIALALLLAGCKKTQPASSDVPGASPTPAVLTNLPLQVRAFIERKEQLALTLAKKLGVAPDRPTFEYFALARKGEFAEASRLCRDLAERGGIVSSARLDTNVTLSLWDPLFEVELTLEAYAKGAGKFAKEYGEAIVQCIPPGSIYFGGTDCGRGLVAAFSSPDADGDPFFVLSQNAFANGRHLAYLRAIFGEKAYMPSDEDSQRCFEAYLDDARKRYEHDQKAPREPRQLKPGEDVRMVNAKPQISGQLAVMAINGLLAKLVFDKNPDREFYLEESFPIDWMYPYLTPHGPIMKINHQPVSELSAAIIAIDHEFWGKRQSELIGGWLTPDTSVREVCAFVEKVFLRKNLNGFSGDPDFVRNDYATAAYSKLRVSQAGLYSWRVSNSTSPEERSRMVKEADFAFRQAFAFGPANPEVLLRYANLLVPLGRLDDSILLARTAAKLNPSDGQIERLVGDLERIKSAATR